MANILLFTRCMGSGGTETVILQLALCYRQAGHKVIVCAEDGNAAAKLPELGVPFFPIPDMQSHNPKIMLRILRTVSRLLREESIQIVHTHHRMAAFYTTLLRPFFSFAFLNNVHNTFSDKKRLTVFSLRHACNIAVGQAVRRNLLEDYALPDACVRVIPNAVMPPVLTGTPDPLLQSLREQGYFLIANIGRVNTQKGFSYYLETAALLQEKPFAFLVVGDGDLLAQVRQQARDMGLANVHFLGYRPDVADVIAQSDLVALSSLWEGFPLTPIEVFRGGKTIVATAVPGTMEIVTDEKNGLIVPLKDPRAMADAILRLYRDPALRKSLEQQAAATYREVFSYPAFCQRYLSLLQEVLP